MSRTTIFAIIFLSASVVSAQKKYSGPKCLGPFCIYSDISTTTLWKHLGSPPKRSSHLSPYCFQSEDGRAFLYVETIDSEPDVPDEVLVSDSPNCLHMPKAVTRDNLNAWKTPEGVGIGSSEQDVLKAYGKPSDRKIIDWLTYRFVIRGYRPNDGDLSLGDEYLFYNGDTDNDLSAAEFGIRKGKVSYVWLSDSE